MRIFLTLNNKKPLTLNNNRIRLLLLRLTGGQIMEIIVKVTDAELAEMDMTIDSLQACIWDDIVSGRNYQCKGHEYTRITIEAINTDDAKRAIKTTKDKHLAIINHEYEG